MSIKVTRKRDMSGKIIHTKFEEVESKASNSNTKK